MAGRIKPVAGLLLFLTAGAPLAAAAPSLTTIQDTLYRADGTRFNGVAFIEWRTFEAADTSNVPAQTITARITEGVLRVALIPTTNATPSAYYRVRFNADGRTEFVEHWAVPPSGTALRLRNVRIPGPLSVGTTPVPPVNTAILITDVAGLRDELDNRPAKGSGFTPGRVTVANSEGELDGVAGAVQDCVRVDGTSGPCGIGRAADLVTGRVTVVNANGELASVAGATTDCVRPDGTTGPCGVAKAATAANGRLALLNASGELATVAGTLTDCVRPDGTTGPCGIAKAATAANGRLALLNASGELATVAGALTDCVRPDGTTGACGLNKAAGFTTGRVTTVNATGELASVDGALTDCVRPDGTTGPCGLNKAAGFTTGRVTTVNATGELASVNGSITECVRPDGTTGPCGLPKATGFTNGRVTLVNGNGELASVGGAPTDCVRADGSTGPCAGGIGFVDGETPAGAIDGVNVTFTLATAPAPATSLRFYRNGLLLTPGADYTLVGSVVTLSTESTPQLEDILLAHYRIVEPSAPGANYADPETPTGVVDGINPTFTISRTPAPIGSLQVYRNGLLMKPGLDYTAAANTITFLAGAVPQRFDVLLVMYRF